jgi:MinD-like ATPase involved in chromosome partitioning or flagellar assembly
MEATVLLTVSGDADTTELQADTTVPLGELVPTWAATCSTVSAAELVVLSGDNRTLFDPGQTLAELRLGYGSVIRLVTATEAMEIMEVQTVTAPAPAPVPAGLSAIPEDLQPEEPSHPEPHGTVQPPTVASHRPTPAPPSSYQPRAPEVAGPPSVGGHPEDAALPAKVSGRHRFWRAVKAGVNRKTPTAQPTGQFIKATQPKAGERYRQALQATDRSHNLEMMIRAATLQRCMVITVVSPKGGPGKTTTTALLGMLLAELRRDPVIALDANPDFGDLKDKLSNDLLPGSEVDDLAHWLIEHPTVTPAELSSRLGVGPHGLRFIPTPRPPEASKERMKDAADFNLYQGLIRRLRDYAGILLVDCGTGLLDPPVRAALEAADQVVLLTETSATTARQVVAAATMLPPGTPTWLVANKMPQRGSMLDLDQVVAEMPHLNGVTILPAPDGGQLAENIVTPSFSWADAPTTWQEPVRELAARLANNWSQLPRSAP